jgi:hypothetical protein
MGAVSRVALGIATLLLCLFVGSRTVVGDPPPENAGELPVEHEPGTPYDLGPHAIPYEEQPADEQANIDRVHERLEANQPAASHDAYAAAVDQAVARAQAEIAERHLGLEGVENQGVVE